ncbi:protein O-glucosyltransferase 2-like isoform X2 [Homarus americanus]|uniref:protein O-glucosyltransferase 2-like isoform X2 n=1 Tax=Homarus americanus TaxID=6706 RepID=UPI001C491686|nr:protein O-glucosyltransferase 2-like isoform X2 [Homarus americanus]
MTIMLGIAVKDDSSQENQISYFAQYVLNDSEIWSRIEKSVGKSFTVQVEGETTQGTNCRVWTQILDRYDGSYIVRYRTYQTCRKLLTIHVLYNSQHVAESPYKISGPVYSEDCYCPIGDISSWQELVSCPTSYEQINYDLKNFSEVDFEPVLKEAAKRFNQAGSRSFCNYVIKDNKVYRKCYGQHVGFKMFMDNILHSMLRKMYLPDVEFIINLGDWPLVDPKVKPLIPVFSWCGSEDTADIIMPTYDITEATLEMMGRVTLDLLSVQSNNDIPWHEKKSQAFWRGRDSRRERLDLITLAREHKHLINASLTNFFFFKDEEDTYGPKEKHVSFFKFFDFKYQINIDGTVAAYRLPYLLGGSGVVLKQDSPYYEFFYHDLEPYVHYIPFKRDLSDLIEKIEWAASNDDKVRVIAENGRQYVQENLMPKNIYCYHAALFQEWSQRLKSDVVVREGMEFVPIKENEKRFGDCQCHLLNRHDEL